MQFQIDHIAGRDCANSATKVIRRRRSTSTWNWSAWRVRQVPINPPSRVCSRKSGFRLALRHDPNQPIEGSTMRNALTW